MKIQVTHSDPQFQMIETDNYEWDCGIWRFTASRDRVTNPNYIRALSEWRADAWEKANPRPKPKHKWEIMFDNGVMTTVEAHRFIRTVENDATFHITDSDGEYERDALWCPNRTIIYVKEIS